MTPAVALMPEHPPLYLAATIDLERAVGWLTEVNAAREAPARLAIAALFLKAVAGALREFPELNGWWMAGRRCSSGAVHLGVAVAQRREPPVIPVVADADRCTLDELMAKLRAVVRHARSGQPPTLEPARPTFTVTSLGELGVQAVFPPIVRPQLGAVGFGKIVEQPSAVAGAIVCSPMVTTTLAADQRATDSHGGARLLSRIDELLQQPEAL
jgi:pyruvate dehydrogenase E2 component (dihydrolipoamide acetyltransferase)